MKTQVNRFISFVRFIVCALCNCANSSDKKFENIRYLNLSIMNYHGICLFAGYKTLRKTKKWYPIPNLCNSCNSCIAEGGRSDIPVYETNNSLHENEQFPT